MPLPRFVQRLFQNDGYGLKLRSEIIPWDDEKRFTALEAWRQAMIGTPMPMAGTTLPPGFMWADGSFASFAAYPELKAKYDAGGFTGMLLAYNASEEDIAAYPGKFKPDVANPAGLFVPRLNGLFARYWCGNEERAAGSWQQDAVQEATGSIDFGGAIPVIPDVTYGVFTVHPDASAIDIGPNGGTRPTGAFFSLSGSCRTAAETRPENVALPIALYLGRPAEV